MMALAGAVFQARRSPVDSGQRFLVARRWGMCYRWNANDERHAPSFQFQPPTRRGLFHPGGDARAGGGADAGSRDGGSRAQHHFRRHAGPHRRSQTHRAHQRPNPGGEESQAAACQLLRGAGDCTTCESPLTEPERQKITIQHEHGATTIARVTCPTAPKFWRWRDMPWPKVVQRDVEFLEHARRTRTNGRRNWPLAPLWVCGLLAGPHGASPALCGFRCYASPIWPAAGSPRRKFGSDCERRD